MFTIALQNHIDTAYANLVLARQSGCRAEFTTAMREITRFRREVEHRSGGSDAAHFKYTSTLLDAAELCRKSGFPKLGKQLARRAQAWADEPMNGASTSLVERSIRVQQKCRPTIITRYRRRVMCSA